MVGESGWQSEEEHDGERVMGSKMDPEKEDCKQRRPRVELHRSRERRWQARNKASRQARRQAEEEEMVMHRGRKRKDGRNRRIKREQDLVIWWAIVDVCICFSSVGVLLLLVLLVFVLVLVVGGSCG